jgi:hypothetical protein
MSLHVGPGSNWCRDFAIPAIIGAIATPVFWYMFKFIDKEEYRAAKVDAEEFNRVHKKGVQKEP